MLAFDIGHLESPGFVGWPDQVGPAAVRGAESVERGGQVNDGRKDHQLRERGRGVATTSGQVDGAATDGQRQRAVDAGNEG